MNILLISTYELGHQPFGLAHPAAILRQKGFSVRTLDLSLEKFDADFVRAADLIGFYLPMHTATRLAIPIISKVRDQNRKAHIAAFGIYAPLNQKLLLGLGALSIFGGEFEPGLTKLSEKLANGNTDIRGNEFDSPLPKQTFTIPDRSTLPSLERYADLQFPNGESKTVGYVESSRGCKHFCRHCPVVPIYQGKFRAIPKNIVIGDIRQQVEQGAQHITIGDPDFLNGPTHGVRIVRALNREFPQLTYDVTIKIEHLLTYRYILPILKETGCLFVTTAAESVNDRILRLLNKGHTRKDFFDTVKLLDVTGLDIAPTFVPFTPWTTFDHYLELLNVIARLGLVGSVSPVQLAIRLLIPPGSMLLQLDSVRSLVGPLDQAKLIYPWKNSRPRVDDLQIAVEKLAQRFSQQPRDMAFREIWKLAHDYAGVTVAEIPDSPDRNLPAQLSEPWYCCAEPTESQYRLV